MKGAKPSFGGPPGVAALGGRFCVWRALGSASPGDAMKLRLISIPSADINSDQFGRSRQESLYLAFS
jgi:hypothetical protein